MENDSTFVAPEGVYSVTDEHKTVPSQLAAVSAGPSLYPTRVSNVVVKFPGSKQGGTQPFANLLGGGSKEGKKDKAPKDKADDGGSQSSSDSDEVEPQPSTSQDHMNGSGPTPEQHTIFSNPSSASGKKKNVARPKHNIRTSSSTFIARIQTAEGLSKTLASKQGDITFLFYNLAKTFNWIEAGSKAKEPLARITFSQHPTCHDVNASTSSSEHLDVIIGFVTGDLIWLDPITSRYGRLNKQGCISSSPCTSVRWVPASSTLFLVSHADGTVIIYDKEREDGVFTPHDPSAIPPEIGASSSEDGSSQKEWDPLDNIFVSMPPWHPVTAVGSLSGSKSDKDKAAKNPVSHWRISRRSVVDFVFSPDVKYVAAISEDGCLRVIDALAEQLVDCYASYFGALSCVAWSPDGRFILTGGQDDLLTIISPWEQRVVARCQGHSSFVSSVAFDELRSDGRTYRFGSVGEDNKLILWDFSSGSLHRPKLATHYQRMSMASTLSLSFRKDRSAPYLPGLGFAGLENSPLPRYHPAPSRNEISVVQPVLVKQLEGDLLSVIQFLPRSLLTCTKTGHVKLWVRPLALKPRAKGNKNQPLPDIADLA